MLSKLFASFRKQESLVQETEGQLNPTRTLNTETVPSPPGVAPHNAIQNPILIGAHHKAGTNWLSSIFRAASSRYDLTMLEGESPEKMDGFDIFFQDHSAFSPSLLKGNFRGVHMIRDPRDVVISGCFYHQRSSESWLHIKRRRYGGLSYQEKLNSYETLSEKLQFEMEHISVLTIKDIWAWNYQNPSFYEVKYEDLIQDAELTQFREMFSFLGFSESNLLSQMLTIAHDNSLFSGKVDTTHVRSGTAQQWPQYFDKQLKQRFLELFGSVLIELGYEKDHSWAELDTPLGASSPECVRHSIHDILYHPDDDEQLMAPVQADGDSLEATIAALRVDVIAKDQEIQRLKVQLESH